MYLHSRMIESGAKVGKANGLRLLLDAETFDYTFHLSASEGFKLAVQHHLGNSLNQLHLKAPVQTGKNSFKKWQYCLFRGLMFNHK